MSGDEYPWSQVFFGPSNRKEGINKNFTSFDNLKPLSFFSSPTT
jgi:hypothetical protein